MGLSLDHRKEIKEWLGDYYEYGKVYDPLQSRAYRLLKEIIDRDDIYYIIEQKNKIKNEQRKQ